MSKLEKLLQRIKNNPRTVRFEEIEKLLLRRGFNESQSAAVQAIIFSKKKMFP